MLLGTKWKPNKPRTSPDHPLTLSLDTLLVMSTDEKTLIHQFTKIEIHKNFEVGKETLHFPQCLLSDVAITLFHKCILSDTKQQVYFELFHGPESSSPLRCNEPGLLLCSGITFVSVVLREINHSYCKIWLRNDLCMVDVYLQSMLLINTSV